MTELLEPINFGEYEVKKIFAAAALYTESVKQCKTM